MCAGTTHVNPCMGNQQALAIDCATDGNPSFFFLTMLIVGNGNCERIAQYGRGKYE